LLTFSSEKYVINVQETRKSVHTINQLTGRRIGKAVEPWGLMLAHVSSWRWKVQKHEGRTGLVPRASPALQRAASKRAIRRGLRLHAQPFESQAEGAQAPSSLPPRNKKTALWRFLLFLGGSGEIRRQVKNLIKLGTYFN